MTDTHSEPLTGLDSWFLYGERHEAPLHIGATYIFEGTPQFKGGRGALGLAQTIEERLHLVPRYRQKVMWLPGNLGNPVWVDDPDFDLSYHVRRAALPRPGDDAALRDYTARVFARPLDLSKPLWEMTVVEGLSGGRVAVVNKVHHAMVDGISTVDLATLRSEERRVGKECRSLCDWSSDVCLPILGDDSCRRVERRPRCGGEQSPPRDGRRHLDGRPCNVEIGRASCRERV